MRAFIMRFNSNQIMAIHYVMTSLSLTFIMELFSPAVQYKFCRLLFIAQTKMVQESSVVQCEIYCACKCLSYSREIFEAITTTMLVKTCFRNCPNMSALQATNYFVINNRYLQSIYQDTFHICEVLLTITL